MPKLSVISALAKAEGGLLPAGRPPETRSDNRIGGSIESLDGPGIQGTALCRSARDLTRLQRQCLNTGALLSYYCRHLVIQELYKAKCRVIFQAN
jgi:hypothetical protein